MLHSRSNIATDFNRLTLMNGSDGGSEDMRSEFGLLDGPSKRFMYATTVATLLDVAEGF